MTGNPTSMLHEFMCSHRLELIDRCREKMARRFAPASTPAAMDSGVPLFLQQVVDILRLEQQTRERTTDGGSIQSPSEISRGATIHGAEMLRSGFTIEQVVREYGDVCQAVTDLASEEAAHITNDEFRTLNRCLDDAIADAVRAHGQARLALAHTRAETLHTRLNAFGVEHLRLVEVAMHALSAIKTGNVGLNGATGTLLDQTLTELSYLAKRALPELHLACAMTTLTSNESPTAVN